MPIVNSKIDETVVIHHESLCNIYDSTLASGVRVGAFTEIGGATIGKHTTIGAHVFICPGVIIGANVFIGPCVRFANDKHPPSIDLQPVVVEDDVVIGIGASILPGVVLGKGCKVAAGAVVAADVAPGECVAGTPARVIPIECWDRR